MSTASSTSRVDSTTSSCGGAENLSPGEIEDSLLAFVTEVAVAGAPGPEWGEAVAAEVALVDEAEGKLQQWVRERLCPTKTPQHIQFGQERPYNETGKLRGTHRARRTEQRRVTPRTN